MQFIVYLNLENGLINLRYLESEERKRNTEKGERREIKGESLRDASLPYVLV